MSRNIHTLVFLAISFALLPACRFIMNKVGESDCGQSGLVADADTTLNCALGTFQLQALDTFYIQGGKGYVKKFRLNCNDHIISTSSTEIKIGMEPDAPPMYFTQNGILTGFDYELLHSLLKESMPNAQIRTRNFAYDLLPEALRTKQIDIIAGGYVADGELKGIDWTEPYLTFGYCLITHVGQASLLKSLSDLKGKKIGVYADGETADWVKQNVAGVAQVIEKVDNENTPASDWMQMLVNREVDAIIYDYPFAAKEVKDYKGELVITHKNLNAPSDMKGYAFGLPCGNTKLLLLLNEAIQKMKNSPQYGMLIARFIPNPDEGKQVVLTPDLQDKAHTYTVKVGETLSLIAQKELGDIARFKEIYTLNKDRLASPDIIYVNTILKMPSEWKRK